MGKLHIEKLFERLKNLENSQVSLIQNIKKCQNTLLQKEKSFKIPEYLL